MPRDDKSGETVEVESSSDSLNKKVNEIKAMGADGEHANKKVFPFA